MCVCVSVCPGTSEERVCVCVCVCGGGGRGTVLAQALMSGEMVGEDSGKMPCGPQ